MSNPPGRPKENYTIKEAAFCLGIHFRTLYRWIDEGLIAYIQVKKGGPIFISDKEIKRIYQEKFKSYDI